MTKPYIQVLKYLWPYLVKIIVDLYHKIALDNNFIQSNQVFTFLMFEISHPLASLLY